MKKDYSILIRRLNPDLELTPELLLMFANYKGVICSGGFDKQLYFCRVSFPKREKRAAVADVLASNGIRFEYPNSFKIAGGNV